MNSFWDIVASSNTLMLFGIASGVLSTIAYIPYILDTLSNRTQPQRASWLIWSVLGSIAVVSQIYEGATSSLWFAGVQVAGTIIVFVLSIGRGSGRFLSRNDYYILMAAAVGLVLWYFTENAAYALAITISISLLGGLATAVKAFYNPDSETLSTWIISFIASACAIVSVGKLDPVLLAYPVYLFTLYLCFIVAIVFGRARRSSATLMSTLVYFGRPMRSALRTTADGVIVVAAIVYVLNNGLPLQLTTSVSPVRLIPMENTSPMLGSVSSIPTSQNFNTDTRSASEFYNTHPDADITLPGVVSTANYQQPLDLLNNANADKILAAELIPQTPPLQVRHRDTINSPFLQLDPDDPFTNLVVTSGSAALIENLTNPDLAQIIPRGESLVALATNGDWFKVSTESGSEGYLHRSQISVETPELPHPS